MENPKKGFTLVELLVVISIIALLTSVALAALNQARAKAADTNIKSNLGSIRRQAEIVYSSNSCYSSSVTPVPCLDTAFAPNICPTQIDGIIFSEPTVANAIATAKTQSAGGLNACSSTDNQTAYAVVTQLKASASTAWCIDSAGTAKQVNLPPSVNQTVMNALITVLGTCT